MNIKEFFGKFEQGEIGPFELIRTVIALRGTVPDSMAEKALRDVLQLEPEIRRRIDEFVNGKFKKIREVLEQLRGVVR